MSAPSPATDAAKRHRHRLVLSRHLTLGHPVEPPVVRALNTAAARHISNVLSSMWFFWGCVILCAFELPSVIAAGSIVLWVTFIAQTCIQLLALPALGAYAKLNQQMQDAQATTQAETLGAIHTVSSDTHSINERQTAMLDQLGEGLATMGEQLAALTERLGQPVAIVTAAPAPGPAPAPGKPPARTT